MAIVFAPGDPVSYRVNHGGGSYTWVNATVVQHLKTGKVWIKTDPIGTMLVVTATILTKVQTIAAGTVIITYVADGETPADE